MSTPIYNTGSIKSKCRDQEVIMWNGGGRGILWDSDYFTYRLGSILAYPLTPPLSHTRDTHTHTHTHTHAHTHTRRIDPALSSDNSGRRRGRSTASSTPFVIPPLVLEELRLVDVIG